jgi:pantetheine-phosphate adenylyltransferase
MQRRVGLYPGTFDPVTNGHLDIIKRALKLVDHLVIGVAINEGKGPLFTLEERVEMVRHEAESLRGKGSGTVEVKSFKSLLMDYAEEVGASVIIRGLRAVADFEYEFQMTGMNMRLNPEIETVFLMAEPKNQAIASKLVKEIAILGGAFAQFTSPYVAERLAAKIAARK